MPKIVARSLVAGFAASLILSTGCSTIAGTGALAGGGIGSVAGALVGAATGNPKTGALLGGALGAGVGGAIGADADYEKEKRADQKDIAQAQAQAQAAIANAPLSRGPLSVGEIVQMSTADAAGKRVSDDILISYIRTTNSTYNLTPQDLQYLQSAGVSDVVVKEMLASRNRPQTRYISDPSPRTVIVREPPPVVVYERPYYGPVFMRPAPPPGLWIHGRL